MTSFAVPSTLPQDLLLIHDIVGQILTVPPHKTLDEPSHSDHDHGTDSDTDSEKEVEADILGDVDEEAEGSPPSESTSDSDASTSSDSDSEPEPSTRRSHTNTNIRRADPDDEDDDAEPSGNAKAHTRSKNEVVDIDITIPALSSVGPHEPLEKVGEIMNVVNDRVVIIKGVPSTIANRGSQKALDSDTLLVFEDRKVLGYIFETFGPTSEPLYQIKFSEKFPLDPAVVQVRRPVFHVPTQSNYVFVRQIQHLKGSDASNVHDEEPGEDELEFSDDEQEAAHKRSISGRREQSRARSFASPLPFNMRDQDIVDDPYGGSSYDSTVLPYHDLTLDTGPSRPAPIPYDDPYSDAYGAAPSDVDNKPEDSPPQSLQPHSQRGASVGSDRGRGGGGHNRNFPPRRDDSGRGRGRGRGRRQKDRGRGRWRGAGNSTVHNAPSDARSGRQGGPGSDEYDPRNPRPLSPTSLAIAQATGQHANGDADMDGGWGYPQYPMQSFDFSLPYQYPLVQPHINPRFAANYTLPGMGMGYGAYGAQSSEDTTGYNTGGNFSGGWNHDWSSNVPPGDEGREGQY